MEIEKKNHAVLVSDGIGIDLGVKELAVCSDGTVIPNINKEGKLKKLQKCKKRLQRAIARKYKINKKGECYRISRNIVKSKNLKRKLEQRIRHLQDDHMGRAIRNVLFKRSAFIGLEDLNVKGMLKNHKLAKAIQEEKFGSFKVTLKRMAEARNIPVIEVSRWYPSSKTCSNCGTVKDNLKLSDRIFICPVCGFTKDRDLNAAINIREHARKEFDVVTV